MLEACERENIRLRYIWREEYEEHYADTFRKIGVHEPRASASSGNICFYLNSDDK